MTGVAHDLVAIRVASAIDGTGSAPIRDATLVFRNDVIEWVGPSSEVVLPVDEVREYPTGFALPGFIDCHTHFTLFADGRSYEEMASESDILMAMAAAKNAQVHLRAGVTTARDNGARNRAGFVVREAIDRGFVDGPRLLLSGRPVTPTGGHFAWCNGIADGELEIIETVKRLVSEGADHIKLMASGGGTVGSDPTKPTYTTRELKSAVSTAHDLGRLTTAHCRATESMKRAIDAGLDCMEHGEFVAPDGDPTFDDEIARRLVDSAMYLSPTIQAVGWDTILRLQSTQELRQLTAEENEALALAQRDTHKHLEHVGRLAEMGLAPRIVVGTDAGCFDTSFGHVDYALELLVLAGMSPMEAVISATSAAASACGVADTVGSLVAGKLADVVILGGDPLADIRAASDVLAVFKSGLLVAR